MPTKLGSKPCRLCGAPVAGIKRADRNAFHYPKTCETCRPFAYPTGERHHNWTGGRQMGAYGYIYIWATVNGKRKRFFEHRHVWAMANGPIPPGHDIHHINHIRSDNRLDNLMLLRKDDHNREHFKVDGWARYHDRCVECGTNDAPHEGHGLCRRCARRKTWARGRARGAPWANRAKYIGVWARGHERCIDCARTDRKHASNGRCFPCYYLWQKATGRR